MDTIIVKVSELSEIVKELKDKKMDYVEIYLSEADEELPPAINFKAMSKSNPGTAVNFGEVEETKETTAKKFLNAIEMSSNLL